MKYGGYKIRKSNPGNPTGESYEITIPVEIALHYQNIPFKIYPSGNGIILDMRVTL